MRLSGACNILKEVLGFISSTRKGKGRKEKGRKGGRRDGKGGSEGERKKEVREEVREEGEGRRK